MNQKELIKPIQLPSCDGKCFCSGNCAGPGDSCVYWEPHKRDSNDRQYCNWYGTYYYPSERGGCLSKKT